MTKPSTKPSTKNHHNAKSEKSCDSLSLDPLNSSNDCCHDVEKVDCCAPQYRKLSTLLTLMAMPGMITTTYGTIDGNASNPKTRGGQTIPPPIVAASPIVGAYYNSASGATAGNVSFNGSTGSPFNQNAWNSYYYVNSVRYLPFESACQKDQLWGWYVDTNTGNLQLYQETDNVPTNVSRSYTMTATSTSSSVLKKQGKVLNKLYKLSLKAIKMVKGIPSTEGNIVHVTDNCGQKWVMYVNLDQTLGANILTGNTQFVIVACKQ